jgi:hypothetical protein
MQISKQRKIELFIISLLSLIIIGYFINFRNVHVKFYNKTGENIDSLIIAETFIGHLKKDSSTESIDFKHFTFDDSIPYEQISAILNSKKSYQLNWSWCGTGRNTESNGSYIFDLKKVIDEKGNTCFYLTNHNQKNFWE